MNGGGEPARRMVRFRPIAPKPIAGGAASVSAAPSISMVRTKRKYVRVTRFNNRKEKKKIRRSSSTTTTAAVATTLQLLPEERHAVEVWVTVDCVTETDAMGEELGRTDEERKKNLEEDTSPGFVSDGENRVEWLNRAFVRMVRQRSGGGGEGESPAVRLVIVSEAEMGLGFTCRIKVEFKIRGREMVKLVPCDAWRMDGGGFAWKLDVKAALTLAPLLQEDFE